MGYNDTWEPKTRLGRLVQDGEIEDMSAALNSGLPLKEPEIVDNLIPGLDDEVLDINMVQRMTDSGRRVKFRCVVVIGNRDGFVGYAEGRDDQVGGAIQKAIEVAKLNIIDVSRGCGSWECGCGRPHTVALRTTGKAGSVEVELIPAPRGPASRAARRSDTCSNSRASTTSGRAPREDPDHGELREGDVQRAPQHRRGPRARTRPRAARGDRVMRAVVQVRGDVNMSGDVVDTLEMLNIHSVNHCALVPETETYDGMVAKVNDFVAFGEPSHDVLACSSVGAANPSRGAPTPTTSGSQRTPTTTTSTTSHARSTTRRRRCERPGSRPPSDCTRRVAGTTASSSRSATAASSESTRPRRSTTSSPTCANHD